MSNADRSGPDTAEERLGDAWARFISDDLTLFARLAVRHRERHRRYHRLDHVDRVVQGCLALAERESLDAPSLVDTVAAAMYHDAIYEPRSSANERASARLARRDLESLGWSHARVERVATMIEGTAAHLDPPDLASAVLYDADLAILGTAPDEYEAYRCAVREEYHHVDDETWAQGRPDVLRAFLGRASVFATHTARERWEAQARANLEREIASLTA